MRKIYLFVLLSFSATVFSQQFHFDYQFDYNKANSNYRRTGFFRVNKEDLSTTLQIFQPNENYFAVIRDFKTQKRHYFYYRVSRNRESFEYIGTVRGVKEIDIIQSFEKVNLKDYPTLENIVFLNKEYGKNRGYYISNDSNLIKPSKKNIIVVQTQTDNPEIPSEIPLFLATKNPTEITLPEKIIDIPFSRIQYLTTCIKKVMYKDFSDIGSNKGQVISNTCN